MIKNRLIKRGFPAKPLADTIILANWSERSISILIFIASSPKASSIFLRVRPPAQDCRTASKIIASALACVSEEIIPLRSERSAKSKIKYPESI